MCPNLETLVNIGPFSLDLEIPALSKGGEEVGLRNLGCKVLKCLYENRRGLTLDQLMRCAWGDKYVDDKTIRQTVGEIRAALGEPYCEWIRTRRGRRGYVFVIPRHAQPDSSTEHTSHQAIGSARYYDGNLPPQQRFFGRVEEHAALTRAYRDRRTRLAIISGPIGGEGKSQLAQHWLSTKFATSKRELQIFTFSFNSQGTSEMRQTSGDQFFVEAQSWFKVQVDPKASPEEKAERLAHAVVSTGAILYLDGIEPLQHEPTGGVAPLREKAMRTLVVNLARPGNHFCLISTRCAMSELQGNPSVRHVPLKGLDSGEAVKLLKSYGVRTEHEGQESLLRSLAKRWGYHPLSLVLLGTYLAKYCEGDVRGADTIRDLRRVDPSVPYRPELMLKAHDRRLSETSEEGLQLLRVLGLFDRPVDERWVSELTSLPIPNISNKLRSAWLSPDQRRATIKHLVDLGLVSTKDRSSSRHIYCHALIQQYQGQSLRTRFPNAWRQANTKLFCYFASVVRNQRPETPGEIQTLYQAVAHGCSAGRFESAFDQVYWPRISRGNEWFSTDGLGLVAEDLACLASFFKRPFSKLVEKLTPGLGAHVLSLSGFRLRNLGRLEDAEHVMKQALIRFEKLAMWEAASGEANNLAVLHRMRGRLEEAVAEGRKAVKYAENAHHAEVVSSRLAALGEFLHYRGNLDEALALFEAAETQHARRNAKDPFLHSTVGFRYCELLLTLGRTSEAAERARRIPVKGTARYWLLDRALSRLCEARALMASDPTTRDLSRAEGLLREAYDLTKKSHHRDNQIRVAVALCECLRLKGRSRAPEAASLIREAMAIADSDRMYLHRLDCEFEDLQLQFASHAPRVTPRLRQLSKKARNTGYGLLCGRIAKHLEIFRKSAS